MIRFDAVVPATYDGCVKEFMRIAYLDCFSGMSGDMFLGALVDAGVPAKLFEDTVEALNIGAGLKISRVNRSGITATKVDVFVHGEKELPREEFHAGVRHSQAAGQRDHEHLHDHGHAQLGAQQHEPAPSQTEGSTPHDHADAHSHEHGHGRSLKQIKRIIGKAEISESAKKTAIAIFEALGAAEAAIHDMDIESLHFHELGAVDALVYIVGAAVGAEALGVGEIVCSPLNVGGGTVKCAHGVFPVPAPATVELLKGAPAYSSGIERELLTPTGAAIVRVL